MNNIIGVILAGGLATRMGGGDKCLQQLGDKTLLDRVIERAKPQVNQLLLNANGDLSRFDHIALPKASDVVDGYAGPLAGLLTGMTWAREHCPNAQWLLSIAADTPFFPEDLVSRLLAQAQQQNAQIAVAESGDKTHPVFGLWHLSLIDDLRTALVEEDIRKIFRWMKRHHWTAVHFPCIDDIDPFFNINSPEDLARARALYENQG